MLTVKKSSQPPRFLELRSRANSLGSDDLAPSLPPFITRAVLILVLFGSGCKRVRGEPAKARVWAAGVVVHPPDLDEGSGRRQAPEQMLVQALVAQAPVQAFDEAILLRLAGRDGMPLNPTLFLPTQDCVRGQLSAVVRDDHHRLAPACDDLVEFARDPPPGQRRVGH